MSQNDTSSFVQCSTDFTNPQENNNNENCVYIVYIYTCFNITVFVYMFECVYVWNMISFAIQINKLVYCELAEVEWIRLSFIITVLRFIEYRWEEKTGVVYNG